MNLASERVRIPVADGTAMQAYVARPSRPGSTPAGVVVLQEAWGMTTWLREVTARFADELGMLAIAPELYHRTVDGYAADYAQPFEQVLPHLRSVTPEGMAADVVAAHGWLLNAGIAAERTAAVGFCMGGCVAFIGNARAPFGAAVSFYGGRIAPHSLGEVPNQHGPVLFLWGGADRTIAAEERRAAEDALDAAGKTYTSVVFSGADHGFFRHARPEVYHPAAAREAWALLIAFLRNHNVIDVPPEPVPA